MQILASGTTWVHLLVTTMFVGICTLLIIVVLLQKGRGGGLAGAFGGAGGHSAFGAKTGDVFTWITVGLTAAFILASILGNYYFVPVTGASVTTPVVAPVGAPQDSGDASDEAAPAEKTPTTQPG
ncbi:MAG: preprotein translocase subunit SecG [Phycisphaerae bacterium]|nr:preprotein translocase subunit SecG [Phycisphaerae bacterium]